ncbi:uncharacterized protein LOC111088678 isoform X2 [Limulus polyphemus]|uniref:Uncharacterized protein LOC111088678 isoform X2 n=1 Tax=Limulus polyphemus TaxID=6850 RepID=A0ABM1TGX6_LIMPO|nr:uncharacterized protein LOC111088678 isoform X2 [Limulus polyphemus]
MKIDSFHTNAALLTRHPSPTSSRLPWQQRRHLRPNTVGIDNHRSLTDWVTKHHLPLNLIRKIRSLWAIDDGLPHKVGNGTDDPTKSDFYARLGYPLSDDAQASPRTTPPRTGSTNPSRQESRASISSLINSETNKPGSANTVESVDTMSYHSANHGQKCDNSRKNYFLSPLATNFHRQLSERIKESSAFDKRSVLIRRSDRSGNRSFETEIRGQIQFNPVVNLPLRPLFFEVAQTEPEPLFIGRQWLFREIEQVSFFMKV